jgi:phage gpG-like protein
MNGVSLHARFDDGPITLHLARLAIADRRKFDGARREIGETVLGDVQDNLDGQKLFDGSAMRQSKAAIKRSGKTLIDRHHLYDSYNYQLEGSGVAVGSGKVYARIHHFGDVINTKRGPVRVWPRPVLGMNPKLERRIGDVLLNELRGLA